MDACMFILLRYYLRVDGVRVRILDTRIYHEFNSNTVLREFKHLESDFDMLKSRGFVGGSEWMLSTTQADEVS
jgi:type 2A phosphatase activator TIP41